MRSIALIENFFDSRAAIAFRILTPAHFTYTSSTSCASVNISDLIIHRITKPKAGASVRTLFKDSQFYVAGKGKQKRQKRAGRAKSAFCPSCPFLPFLFPRGFLHGDLQSATMS
jgi:hypothetical protein